ncbi:MAG TPA: hypothetical protein VG318_16730 [Actinomycetota bacterium]|nr:hypothetical protein [Actinomycetota bacterium]
MQVGRTRRSFAALALVAGAAGAVSLPPATACAGEGARAALVVDTGAAVTTYCVALPDDSVTGIELVQLAGEQHGLDYSLGFGGEAVCRLEGVGPEGDDCFGEYPEFWGYWHGNGSGGWTWAGTGAGSASIEDGDVDGWSWGSGDNGSNHQQPPATEFGDVCAVEAPPPPSKPERSGGRDRPAPGPATAPPAVAAPAPTPDAASGEPQRDGPAKRSGRGRPERERPSAAPGSTMLAPTPEPSTLSARPANDEDDAGPPVTGLLGLAAAGGLAAAVWAGTRRRSRG